MKKIKSIAVMLILTVILAQLPLLSASADTYGDYSYKILSDGTAEITGYSGSDTCLTIPNEINGYTVTSIGDSAFFEHSNITSITIPDSVTSIGSEAFINTAYYNNNNNWDKEGVLYINKHLIKAKPDVVSGNYDVKEGTVIIADEAFTGCSRLTNITMPDSVTSIGERAFSDCSSLTSITIPDNVTSIDTRQRNEHSKLCILLLQ